MKKIKATQEALKIFEEAAAASGDATEIGDSKTCNKSYHRIVKAMEYLKENNEREALLPFLNHKSVGVQSWAAAYLLPIKEEEALKVLEEISLRNDIHALDGKYTIIEWKKGNLKSLY
jgi:hypothetical protein